ncbi:MAG TPA: quinohemoprotein amine dehydrogenase maturation protein [Candidatus Binatia bacterium]|nr:quinohemoprotein amine dehydrogenase maturation protein [Candidatus Binatia bacterium]
MEYQFRPENAHVVPYGGKKVLVAAKSMSLFVLDPASEAILGYAETRPHFTFERMTEEFAGRFSPQEVAETLQELVGLHVFTTEQIRPGPVLPVVDIEHFPLGSLVLNVANKCNLHCTYCYEPEAAKYGPSPVQMDWEVARASVDFLFRRAGKNREVNLIFFGGEALLNFKLMREVVAYAEERGRVLDKKVDFSLTTNGTLLTDEVVDFFQEHRFGLTVSIDGPQDVHDRRRSFLTKRGERKGSYELLLPRVQRLLQRYTARPVVARVTVTKGAVEVTRVYEHLSGLGFFEVGFSPVTAKNGEEYGLEPADLRRVLAGFKDLGRLYVERALRNQYTGFANLSTLLTDIHAGTNKLFPCGAGLGLLDVDGNGDVYLCHRFPGSEEHKYGNVKDGLRYDRLNEFLNAAHVENKPVCQTCWVRGLCGGGCYHEAYTQFGDGALPNLHYCDFLREWTEYGIGVYMELQEKNPGFVETYVLRGRGDAPRELT